MKIVLSSNTSWNLVNFRLGLIKSLINEGYEVYTLAPRDKYSTILEDLGCNFEEINLKPQNKNPIREFFSFFSLFKNLYIIRPEYFLGFTIKINIFGSIVCQILKIKCILNVTGLGQSFSDKSSFLYFIATKLYKVSLKKINHIFFQNKNDESLFKELNLLDGLSFSVLPGSGVDIDFFKPEKKLNKGKEFSFLFLGRLQREKGIFEYLSAARTLSKKFNNISFKILGNFDKKDYKVSQEIKALSELGLVQYLGFSDKVKSIILESSCVVLPTYYREGTPRSLIEAAACGKVIITSDWIGSREVVDDGINGYLVEPKNSKALAKKMIQVMNLPEEKIKKMGEASREKAIREFDEKIVISQYLNRIKK